MAKETPVKREDLPEWARFAANLTDHPIIQDEQGIFRYKKNPMIRWLCDHIDLNDMWRAYRNEGWDTKTFMQFYRDIGYSLGGFEEIWGDELDEMESLVEESQPPSTPDEHFFTKP